VNEKSCTEPLKALKEVCSQELLSEIGNLTNNDKIDWFFANMESCVLHLRLLPVSKSQAEYKKLFKREHKIQSEIFSDNGKQTVFQKYRKQSLKKYIDRYNK
jgi:deoxyadenosine/deoxycytidine kinase